MNLYEDSSEAIRKWIDYRENISEIRRIVEKIGEIVEKIGENWRNSREIVELGADWVPIGSRYNHHNTRQNDRKPRLPRFFYFFPLV